MGNMLSRYDSFGNSSLKSKQEKPMKKCLRKDCDNLTSHNGGYCSAECCKIDRNKGV